VDIERGNIEVNTQERSTGIDSSILALLSVGDMTSSSLHCLRDTPSRMDRTNDTRSWSFRSTNIVSGLVLQSPFSDFVFDIFLALLLTSKTISGTQEESANDRFVGLVTRGKLAHLYVIGINTLIRIRSHDCWLFRNYLL
jgi:hypothetical protein